MKERKISLKNVKVHNLKDVSLDIPINELTVFTGVSGSGKSSLAFDTIYVEGQRRFIESLSNYTRKHMGDLAKPDADNITGISPTIAIEQKTVGKNPRSTVGTLTGIYDYLRVLFAKVGQPHCPVSGEALNSQSDERIIHAILKHPKSRKCILLVPFVQNKKSSLKDELTELQKKGFLRARLDNEFIETTDEIDVDETKLHTLEIVFDRFVSGEVDSSRITESVTEALELGKGIVILHDTKDNHDTLYSKFAYAKKSKASYPPLDPQDFSFNHPQGMCEECEGLGVIAGFNLDLIIDENKSIAQDCCIIGGSYSTVKWGNIYDNVAKLYNFDVNTPWKDLSDSAKKVFLYGSKRSWIRMKFIHPTKGTVWHDYVKWRGIIYEAKKRIAEAKSDAYHKQMSKVMQEEVCSACEGSRIKPYPAVCSFYGKTIHEVTSMTIEDCFGFLEKIELKGDDKLIGHELLEEIKKRLHFLKTVGLHYLTLERISPTLSGGEGQRVRLASHIGSGLVNATYILDEPSIGLHPSDHHKLIETLIHLRDQGNTVLVVEHDEETIMAADNIVDVGPHAGSRGGKILFSGAIDRFLNEAKDSFTHDYLTGKRRIDIPPKREISSHPFLEIIHATQNNLNGIDIKIPLQSFVCVTGVSGSGKSSLILDILYPNLSNKLNRSELTEGAHKGVHGHEHLDKVIAIDQSPIGKTPRSNPATYIKVFDDIRELFVKLKESIALGFKPGRFSFNVLEGSCPNCQGMGAIKIDMDFMEDSYQKCPVCLGRRFDEKTLSVHYKGKNIFDVLEMSIDEALEFFDAVPQINKKLSFLSEVGLGYMRLGQSSTTLSGGEAQRIKLAKELIRPASGNTFYILDEPTTGLHFHDMKKLISILQTLVHKGNSLVVIEHNMDLIKCADWVIDLGPGGGDQGGNVVDEAPPEKIAKKQTPTGKALKPFFAKKKKIGSSQSTSPKARFDSSIQVKDASQNNLKKVSISIPHDQITVCTGPSGSGKSSFAFETVYAEGQRRYVETMSAYSRQFVKQMPKASVGSIDGLSPAIAIEQRHHAGNPRSSIGTMTECYDFLRILYAHLGKAFCPDTGDEIKTISAGFVAEKLMEEKNKTKLTILSPIEIHSEDVFKQAIDRFQRKGFLRIRLNNKYYEIDEEIPFKEGRKNHLYLVVDRIVIKDNIRSRLLDAIESSAKISSDIVVVDIEGKDKIFNLAFAVEKTGKSYPKITPQTFSFNAEQGMCHECQGLGIQYSTNILNDEDAPHLTPSEILVEMMKESISKSSFHYLLDVLEKLGIDPDIPLNEQEKEPLNVLLQGSDTVISIKKMKIKWVGLNSLIQSLATFGKGLFRKPLQHFLTTSPCSSCTSTRLNPLARNVQINNTTLPDLCHMTISQSYDFLKSLKIPKEKKGYLSESIELLLSKLSFLIEIGLDYLSLDRSAPTLSGGETQRIYLARQLGSGLTGTLYVLDEPTIGLHPHNNHLLNQSLLNLKALNNTILLIEHDPLTIEIADHVIDFGPGAGKQGGSILSAGTLEEVKKDPKSITGEYLSGKKLLDIPNSRRTSVNYFEIQKAQLHNLKNIDVRFSSNIMTCVTGVSGSGKSTLIQRILKPLIEEKLGLKPEGSVSASLKGGNHFDKLIFLDQNPIGQTSRSDVGTYVELLIHMRKFFSELPQAQKKGLKPRFFSYNHKRGMCRTCFGLGYKTVQLQFLPSVRVTCEACRGNRLNPNSLAVMYKGKHFGDILKLTIAQAKDFLPPVPKVQKILSVLTEVGLDYLTIGQEIKSLSGGEGQRIRLAKELIKRSTGKTLYLFDEPTIGLHQKDIEKLIKICHRIADAGNTLILIEHNLDVIAQADFVIDIGPDGGEKGGQIVARGTPEEIAKSKNSYTGQYLKKYFKERL